MAVCCVEGQSKRNALVQAMPIYVLLRRSMAHLLKVLSFTCRESFSYELQGSVNMHRVAPSIDQ